MPPFKVAVIDCLGRGRGVRRYSTLDAIGVGPRLVAGILRSCGCEVSILQCEDVIKVPGLLSGYEAVFISGMATDVNSMLRALSRWSGGPAVAGGPSFVECEYLLRSGFDYVVCGEGEESIPKLVKYLKGLSGINEVPNLAYRVKGRVVKNPGPPWCPSPPLWSYRPANDLIKNYPSWWGSRVYVEVVRGCSNFRRPTIPLPDGRKCVGCGNCFNASLSKRLECPAGIPPGCGYCSVPSLFGPARSRPTKEVVDEVRELIKLGVRRIVLSAPDFLDYGRDWLVYPEPLTNPREPPPNIEALESLLKELVNIDEVSSGEAYIMIENVKPNLVNDEVAEVLGRYLRGSPVNVGLESGHPAHHVSLGRPSRVNEVIRAVKLLRRSGLKPYVYVIHGLPGEDREVVRETIKTVRKVWKAGAEKVTLYRFTPIKGTAFESFPRPPPAVKSPAKPLYDLVRKLNYEGKRRLIGKVVKAVVVSKEGKRLIAYTLPHGPVVKVRPSRKELLGKVILARVVKALSDRVVEAELVSG